MAPHISCGPVPSPEGCSARGNLNENVFNGKTAIVDAREADILHAAVYDGNRIAAEEYVKRYGDSKAWPYRARDVERCRTVLGK